MLSLRLLLGLALASTLSCAMFAREKPAPATADCLPRQQSTLIYDENHHAVRREIDRNRDGRVDMTLLFEHERIHAAEVDLDYDGTTDLWVTFDEEERIASWKGASSTGHLPQDRPPPELARMVPAFDPPADADCLGRPEVTQYLAALKERVYARWAVPSSLSPGRTRLNFSLDETGTVVGACVREADDARVGAAIVTALFDAGPFEPMPERARCLARHHLIGTFATEAR
jgi:hypothetical protein